MLNKLSICFLAGFTLILWYTSGQADALAQNAVDMPKFIKLMEEYTTYTKNEPQSSAELEETTQLIDQIRQDQIKIREELKRLKFFNETASNTDAKRLEQAHIAAETALKELYKRRNQIHALAYEEPQK